MLPLPVVNGAAFKRDTGCAIFRIIAILSLSLSPRLSSFHVSFLLISSRQVLFSKNKQNQHGNFCCNIIIYSSVYINIINIIIYIFIQFCIYLHSSVSLLQWDQRIRFQWQQRKLYGQIRIKRIYANCSEKFSIKVTDNYCKSRF